MYCPGVLKSVERKVEQVETIVDGSHGLFHLDDSIYTSRLFDILEFRRKL